jgi:beta-galactosidase GanA
MVRQGETDEFLFVVNHNSSKAQIDYANWKGVDILSGQPISGTESLAGFAVRIVQRSLKSVG